MNKKILIGVDGGQNSIGLAAIIIDENGMPIDIPMVLSTLHDNGKDQASSGQTSAVSRKASAGIGRRTRTQTANRKELRNRVEQALEKYGFTVPDLGRMSTYEPWEARSTLLDGYVADDAERKRLVGIALSHMARHRGWVNAWLPFRTVLAKTEPTGPFLAAAQAVRLLLHSGEDEEQMPLLYQADLAKEGQSQLWRLRSRENRKPAKGEGPLERVTTFSFLGKQMREDVIREWREIARVQRLDEEIFLALAEAAFKQRRPYVPVEVIGKEWVPGHTGELRAPLSSAEAQEFRIRSDVAHLRVKTAEGDVRALSVEEQHALVDTLFGLDAKKDAPRWADLAEILGVPASSLVHNRPDQQLRATAPRDRIGTAIGRLPKGSPIHLWWKANPDFHSALAIFLSNQDDPTLSDTETQKVDAFLSGLSDKELETLEASIKKAKLPSGRAAHSRQVLELMSQEIEKSGDDYVTVRNRLFGKGQNLVPPGNSLVDPDSHPTIQRVLPPLRRFIGQVQQQLGPIERVNIEHVRSALMGLNEQAEFVKEQRSHERERQLMREEIELSTGIAGAKDSQISKYLAWRRQDGQCLYCGVSTNPQQVELDHIVPRATGGSSRRANLAAVCRDCNHAKGKQPFPDFARTTTRNVTMPEVLQRVDSLQSAEFSRNAKALKRFRDEMKRRLQQTVQDDPIDERSLESTALAATELRRRIEHSLPENPDGKRKSAVYRGSIVSAARKASGIDKAIALRPELTGKSRLDRRHHAIDAIVVALMNDSVARTLAERNELRSSEHLTGQPTHWQSYEGDPKHPAQLKAFQQWKKAMRRAAEIVRQKIADDDIPVMQWVRFGGKASKLHEDGRLPDATKKLGEAWSALERARVADPRVYLALSGELAPSSKLPEDAARTLRLPSGKVLGADDDVYVFPDSASRLPLKNHSSAELGQTTNHVRIYAYRDAKGNLRANVVRVFDADLNDLEREKGGGVLRAPFKRGARAVRGADMRLQDAIWSGTAKHVESVVIGDEIEIDPQKFLGKNNVFADFLEIYPEAHWLLSGWGENTRFLIRPAVLSEEGLPKIGTADGDQVSSIVRDVLKKGARLSTSDFLNTDGIQVVRRTATGRKRLHRVSGGLPSSYYPKVLIQEAWDEIMASD